MEKTFQETAALRNSVLITDPEEKQKIARSILEALQDWFAITESREEYIRSSAEQPFFAAFRDNTPVGFLCLKETGDATVELAVMGVLKNCHRQGIGKDLFSAAKEYAVKQGYEFMQVKTVQMGLYDDYDATNRFYQALGFKELEVFPDLWDEANPCQIYVMSLRRQQTFQDLISSRRSYRAALPQEAVRKEIVNGRGHQFDPGFADIMLKMIDEDVRYELRDDGLNM